MKETAAVDTSFSAGQFFRALLILPKPGIVLLSLVAGWTGVYIGSHGSPDSYVLIWTTIGLGLATAGAATLNNFLDRDIDSAMKRTSKRSLPSGVISPAFAYLLGTGLVIASLLVTDFFLGRLVMVLNGAAIFTYVVLYTLYLKRTTPFATHIGGIAGALPPLIGYAAAHGTLDFNAFILFLIIVVWQQPHFWALALKYKADYASAGIPILPVAKGVHATKVRLFWYTVALLPTTVIPYYAEMAGSYYLATALALNAVYIGLTVRFLYSKREKEMVLFFFSIFYLGVLFAALVLDMI